MLNLMMENGILNKNTTLLKDIRNLFKIIINIETKKHIEKIEKKKM